MNWKDYIVSDKDVLLGKPTIIGTRISVDHIVGLLAQGWNETQILENYPRISKASLQAVYLYIQSCMQDGFFYSDLKRSI
jgi:uncharacterized protein (DUF433 family)